MMSPLMTTSCLMTWGMAPFHIASGMGKHENHLATNILTCSMAAGTSAGHNMAMADIGGGVGADGTGDADIRHNGHGEEDDSGNGDNSSELTDLNT